MIRALRGEVGGWGLRGLVRQALVMLVYHRLGRICRDIERVVERFQAGSLGRIVRVVGPRGGVVGDRRARMADWVLPVRFGWLVWAVGYQAAGYGSQLQAVLGQPEVVALLKASPRAGRILRPLCRMLAVDTAMLRPLAEGEVAPVPVVRVATPRVRKARPIVDWGRIALPRGVLSWARRERALERAKALVRGED